MGSIDPAMRPLLFISAVSQDDFATGDGELRAWLARHIDCREGVLQLVGESYGAGAIQLSAKNDHDAV